MDNSLGQSMLATIFLLPFVSLSNSFINMIDATPPSRYLPLLSMKTALSPSPSNATPKSASFSITILQSSSRFDCIGSGLIPLKFLLGLECKDFTFKIAYL